MQPRVVAAPGHSVPSLGKPGALPLSPESVTWGEISRALFQGSQSLLGPWGHSLPPSRSSPGFVLDHRGKLRHGNAQLLSGAAPCSCRGSSSLILMVGAVEGHKHHGTLGQGQGHPAQSPFSPCPWCHHQDPNMLWEGEGDSGHGGHTHREKPSLPGPWGWGGTHAGTHSSPGLSTACALAVAQR